MLKFLWGKASDRKLRLILCACCRQFLTLPRGDILVQAVAAAEKWAEGMASRKELRTIRHQAFAMLQEGMGWREEDIESMMDAVHGWHFEDRTAYHQDGLTTAFVAARAMSERLDTGHLRQVLSLLADTLPESRKNNKWQECQGAQCRLLRCAVGNPFRPAAISPSWLTPTVTNLANAGYQERALPSGELDSTRLAVLADALEEAGCQEDILGHLRDPGPHVRGCHVLDLLLGKE
jgi:hypothetical protein